MKRIIYVGIFLLFANNVMAAGESSPEVGKTADDQHMTQKTRI